MRVWFLIENPGPFELLDTYLSLDTLLITHLWWTWYISQANWWWFRKLTCIHEEKGKVFSFLFLFFALVNYEPFDVIIYFIWYQISLTYKVIINIFYGRMMKKRNEELYFCRLIIFITCQHGYSKFASFWYEMTRKKTIF